MYIKHFRTTINNKQINKYIAFCMEEFIRECCKENNTLADGLLYISMTSHDHLDYYINIPRGIEGDHLIRAVDDAVKCFISRFPNRHEEYLSIIIDAYKTNHRIEIKSSEHGIWIDIPKLMF